MTSNGSILGGEAKHFIEVLKKFFAPLRLRKSWPLSLFVWGLTIIIVFLLYVTTGVAELARANSEEALYLSADALLLGSEPIWDNGMGFREQMEKNAEALRTYTKEQIPNRHLSPILSLLHPEYDPRKRLLPLLAELQKPPEDETKARDVMWKVGKEINEFYKDLEKLSSTKVIWFKSERLPEDLIRDINEAFEESEKLLAKLQTDLDRALSDQVLDELEKKELVEDALAACQANRRTMLLLFLGRMGYGSGEKIQQFLNLSERAVKCKKTLAEKIKDAGEKKIVTICRDSEQRRVKILKAMLAHDMEEARRLLREAVDKAYADKDRLNAAEQAP